MLSDKLICCYMIFCWITFVLGFINYFGMLQWEFSVVVDFLCLIGQGVEIIGGVSCNCVRCFKCLILMLHMVN
jgi:hypothetical protein